MMRGNAGDDKNWLRMKYGAHDENEQSVLYCTGTCSAFIFFFHHSIRIEIMQCV